MRPEADEHGIRNILTNMRSFYCTSAVIALSGGLGEGMAHTRTN